MYEKKKHLLSYRAIIKSQLEDNRDVRINDRK